MLNKLAIPTQLEIQDVAVLKVLSAPVRMEIIKHIGTVNKRGERCTVKQLAGLMDMPQTKLYYHIRLLEKHNLLVVGATRMVSGIQEKLYQVAALDFTLGPDALSTQTGPKDLALEEVLNSISQIVNGSVSNVRSSLITKYEQERAARESGQVTGEQVAIHISQSDLLLTVEQADRLRLGLTELMQTFEALSNENLEDTAEATLFFELTQMFVPQYQRHPPPENESQP
jgi:DNA-binding transcriptional ArsR family regulator